MYKKYTKNALISISLVFSIFFIQFANAENEPEILTKNFDSCAKPEKYHDGRLGAENAADLMADSIMLGGMKYDPKYENLPKLINLWETKKCTYADGVEKFNYISFGIDKAIRNWGEKSVLKKIDELKKIYPNAAFPILAEALYWYHSGWKARGSGFASSVTEEGWAKYFEDLAVAEKILLENKKLVSQLPHWYSALYGTQVGLNRPKETLQKLLNEGVSKNKNFLPLYITVRNSREPKWGGSWKEVDDIINWAANQVDKENKKITYSRLYLGAYLRKPDNLDFFKETKVSWVRLKSGFDEMLKRYPNSQATVNQYMSLACSAGDKETYRRVSKKFVLDLKWEWVRGIDKETCDARFG